jgi:hypothetical protein
MGRIREKTTPQAASARAPMVASFYLALAIAGFFWHATNQENNDIWRLDAEQGLTALLWTPVVGVIFGAITVVGFRLLETHMAWLPELHREFRAIFGRPRLSELFLLAASSAIAEELFFRGAMLDAWGVWTSSIVFALLHLPPKRSLWPWTVSSFVLGLMLAGLTVWTGNLGAAVAAHFVINMTNLAYITRRAPAIAVTGPIRPADPV